MRNIFWTLVLFSSVGNSTQNCPDYILDSTPTSRYMVDSINGTVIDNKTGLMWQQCSVGQISAEGNCAGTGSFLNWEGALQAAEDSAVGGYTDWRLPNKKELSSLVAFNCGSPSINQTVFPNTYFFGYFWSSSPVASDDTATYIVSFNHGTADESFRLAEYSVRLVR